jgi:hypothetical protein
MLGAAFRGAGLSRQFKVKEIKVKDITPYPIEVNHSSEPKESEDGNNQVTYGLNFETHWFSNDAFFRYFKI